MKTHELKTWPHYFWAVYHGIKRFEIRKDDRGFEQGDVLVLKEWDPSIERYSGHELRRKVGYIARCPELPGYLGEGVVVMGLEEINGE